MQVKKDVYKMFGNCLGILWSSKRRSLKYRVNLKGTPHKNVQAQKHVSLLLQK